MASYLDELISKAKEKKKLEESKAELKKIATAKAKEEVKIPKTKKEIGELMEAIPKEEKPALLPKKRLDERLKLVKEGVIPKEKEEGGEPEKERSEFAKEVEKSKKIEVTKYGDTTIYKIPGQPLLHYTVPVPRPTAAEKATISTIKEAATRLISIAPYKIRDPEQRRAIYYQRIMEILESSPELNIPKHRFAFYAKAVVREMVGYGIIDALIKDDLLEEIMVIGAKQPVYVFHRQYEMMTTNIEFYSESEVVDLINKIARKVGRRVDISSPLLDARLADGSRVNATIPPASVSGPTLTIRKFREDPYSIIDLINLGTLNSYAAGFLWLCVEGLGVKPANILIAGGTGSGKTTTLNVLAAFIPSPERIISIEDTAELNLPLKHWIRMEAKPPGLEGRGELTLDILTKNCLRMRPDRVIVGEVRHDEAFTLFTAMNTGHDGCLGTIHANSPEETIARVTSPPMNVPEIMLSGLDFIVVEHRIHDKKKGTIRRITEIAEVSGVLAGKARTQTLFEYDPATDSIKRTNLVSNYLNELSKFTGLKKNQIDEQIKKRADFLQKLTDRKVRKITETSKKCQEFLSNANLKG